MDKIECDDDVIQRQIEYQLCNRGYVKMADYEYEHWVGHGSDDSPPPSLEVGQYRIYRFRVSGASFWPRDQRFIQFERFPGDGENYNNEQIRSK